MEKEIKPKKIKNLEGFLCRSIDGRFFFRTHNEDCTFNDHEIHHFDLKIKIIDTNACIRNKNGILYIDYN